MMCNHWFRFTARTPGKSTLRRERGGTAAIVALMLIPLMLAAGVSVDLLRALSVRASLQSAVDAAALAGASLSSRLAGKVVANATAYFNLNGISPSLAAVAAPSVVQDTTAQKVTVTGTATMNTTIMRIVGIKTMVISASATAAYAGTPKSLLELVVATDVSASMNTKFPDGTTPQGYSVATSAMSFVINLETQVTKARLRAGVVPFNSYVMVNKNSIPAGIASGGSIGTAPSCNCYNSCDGVSGACVSTCEGGRFMCQGGSTIFFGCVGPYVLDQNKTPYPRAYGDCGITNLQMQDLVYDAAYARIALQKTSVTGVGPTFIPSGLLWAWNMLTPEIPLTNASAANTTMKMVLLISDGINTGSPRYPSFPVLRDEGGDFVDAKVNPDISWLDGAKADALTRTLCRKMKDQGIIIYTLLVGQATANSTALMRDCATDPIMSYQVSLKKQLTTTFSSIQNSMAVMFQTAGSGGPPYLVK